MPLTIVIPVSQADVSRLEHQIALMEFFSGLQKHLVLFACAPTVHARVSEMASRIRSICPQTYVESLPREPEPIGRFGAFNTIFRDSVELLYKRGNQNPWLWMEVDMVPVRGGWADRLELEYHRAGQPFMGVRRKAGEVIRDANGEALDERDPRAQGDYMVAVGIYPPNFKDFSTMYKYPDPSGRTPTDVNIRHEVNKGLHATQVIDHHWGTVNYRRQGSQIICDDQKHEKGFPSYAGPVSDLAFLVHGVKDDSLCRLILSETPANVSEMPAPSNGFQGSNAAQEALQRENEELRRDIANLQEQWRLKENSYAEEIERLKEGLLGLPAAFTPSKEDMETVRGMMQKPEPAAEDIQEKPLPTLDAIKATLRNAKKSLQLSVLAADFGCNKKALRELIQTDPGIRIAPGGLAWVSLAA